MDAMRLNATSSSRDEFKATAARRERAREKVAAELASKQQLDKERRAAGLQKSSADIEASRRQRQEDQERLNEDARRRRSAQQEAMQSKLEAAKQSRRASTDLSSTWSTGVNRLAVSTPRRTASPATPRAQSQSPRTPRANNPSSPAVGSSTSRPGSPASTDIRSPKQATRSANRLSTPKHSR